MVFFHNITIGARVQVRWRGGIENGVIRYAGNMVTKDGEWVGLELDNRGSYTSRLGTFLQLNAKMGQNVVVVICSLFPQLFMPR